MSLKRTSPDPADMKRNGTERAGRAVDRDTTAAAVHVGPEHIDVNDDLDPVPVIGAIRRIRGWREHRDEPGRIRAAASRPAAPAASGTAASRWRGARWRSRRSKSRLPACVTGSGSRVGCGPAVPR